MLTVENKKKIERILKAFGISTDPGNRSKVLNKIRHPGTKAGLAIVYDGYADIVIDKVTGIIRFQPVMMSEDELQIAEWKREAKERNANK